MYNISPKSCISFEFIVFYCGLVKVDFIHILQEYFPGTGAIIRGYPVEYEWIRNTNQTKTIPYPKYKNISAYFYDIRIIKTICDSVYIDGLVQERRNQCVSNGETSFLH